VRSNDRAAIGFLNDPNRVNVAISRAKKLLVIVGDSKTVIGGAPELFGPLFEHCKEDGLVAGVGAVVTACQRVGIRSQVQRLSRPHRGDRRARRRRRGQRMPVDATGNGSTGSSPTQGEASELVGITPVPGESVTPAEAMLSSNGSEPMATPEPAPAATESQPQDE
jgi:hypothetical protein